MVNEKIYHEALSFIGRHGIGYLPHATKSEKKYFSEKGILYDKDGKVQKKFISDISKSSHSFAV